MTFERTALDQSQTHKRTGHRTKHENKNRRPASFFESQTHDDIYYSQVIQNRTQVMFPSLPPPPPPPTKYAYPLCTSSLISIPTWWRVWLRFLFYLVYNTPGHHAKNTPCMLDVSCLQLAFSKVKTNLGLDQANSCFTAAAPISKDVSIFLFVVDHTT